MPRRIHLHVHTKIYPNLKSISELFKMNMKSLDSFILASRDDNQTLGCLRLYGDSRISRAQPRINAYKILLQHYWLLFFFRHNRFAETHTYLQHRPPSGGRKWSTFHIRLYHQKTIQYAINRLQQLGRDPSEICHPYVRLRCHTWGLGTQ